MVVGGLAPGSGAGAGATGPAYVLYDEVYKTPRGSIFDLGHYLLENFDMIQDACVLVTV